MGHLCRNFGILVGLLTFFTCTYLLATEFVTMIPPRSDVLLFQRGHMPSPHHAKDEESGPSAFHTGPEETSIDLDREQVKPEVSSMSDGVTLLWSDLNYQIKVGKTDKRILNNIFGYVKPGELTALMVRIFRPYQFT